MKVIDKIITKFEDIVTVLCFTSMTIIILLNIAFRSFFSNPIIWAEEVARYLMIWGIFIGLSVVTRKKAQIGIDILVSVFKDRMKIILSFITHLVLIITYVILLVLSILFVRDAIGIGQLTPITRIPFAYVYLALPIGFTLCIYRSIQIFWDEHVTRGQKVGVK